MSHQGFFITGTDTEVGKTLVAAALILKLQAQGLRAVGFKPVAAGLKELDGQLINDDVETLLRVSQRVDSKLTTQDICPFLLPEPAAPHLVAKKHGIHLSKGTMLERFEAHANQYDIVIVEGAGGFLVPINDNYTMGDLAKELQLPVILVVNIKLGCINHALLSIEAIHRKGLKVHGWISNMCQPATEFSDENITSIEKMLHLNYGVNMLGQIPYLENISKDGIYSDEIFKQFLI